MQNLDGSCALTNIKRYENKKQMDFLIMGTDLKMAKRKSEICLENKIKLSDSRNPCFMN